MEVLVIVAMLLLVPAVAILVAVRRRAPLVPVVAIASLSVGAEVLSAALALIAGLSCDEGCDDRSSYWRDNPDAWQWDLIGALAFAGVLFAGVALFAIAFERRRLTGAALLAAVIAEAAGWALVAG